MQVVDCVVCEGCKEPTPLEDATLTEDGCWICQACKLAVQLENVTEYTYELSGD